MGNPSTSCCEVVRMSLMQLLLPAAGWTGTGFAGRWDNGCVGPVAALSPATGWGSTRFTGHCHNGLWVHVGKGVIMVPVFNLLLAPFAVWRSSRYVH